MRTPSFARWPCSVARAVDLLGDPRTPLILREAFYGFRRFEEFQSELGIARNTLRSHVHAGSWFTHGRSTMFGPWEADKK